MRKISISKFPTPVEFGPLKHTPKGRIRSQHPTLYKRGVLHSTTYLPLILNLKNQIISISSIPAGFSDLNEITTIVLERYERPPLVLLLRFSKKSLSKKRPQELCCADKVTGAPVFHQGSKAVFVTSWWPYIIVPATACFLLEK